MAADRKQGIENYFRHLESKYDTNRSDPLSQFYINPKISIDVDEHGGVSVKALDKITLDETLIRTPKAETVSLSQVRSNILSNVVAKVARKYQQLTRFPIPGIGRPCHPSSSDRICLVLLGIWFLATIFQSGLFPLLLSPLGQ